MPSTVVTELDAATFVRDHLVPGRPVLVRGALAAGAWPPPWQLPDLVERFGERRAPLTDSLFTLTKFTTLRKYVDRYTGEAVRGTPPYLRWFVQQDHGRQPWADGVFEELTGDWTPPGWLPDRDYVFPPVPGRVDPARDPFPAKALFICGRGGRTRLHSDPWVSDACLCQLTGRKRLVMYPPGTGRDAGTAGPVIELDAPDDTHPLWAGVEPAFDEVLRPGDALFIPSGWYHTALALDDSVSITWNFVHRTHQARFERYLSAGGADHPTVRYFLERAAEHAAT